MGNCVIIRLCINGIKKLPNTLEKSLTLTRLIFCSMFPIFAQTCTTYSQRGGLLHCLSIWSSGWVVQVFLRHQSVLCLFVCVGSSLGSRDISGKLQRLEGDGNSFLSRLAEGDRSCKASTFLVEVPSCLARALPEKNKGLQEVFYKAFGGPKLFWSWCKLLCLPLSLEMS